MAIFKLFGLVILAISVYVGVNRMYIRSAIGSNGFGYSTTAEQIVDGLNLESLTILVTGGNSGLGFESARVLAKQGASVVLLARSLQKAQSAIDSIRAEIPSHKLRLTPLACDLSSLTSIEQAARDFKSLNFNLNVLINNAGIMALPDRSQTIDGFEKQMGVNHLGHFHLTNLLLPHLIEAASNDKPSRIVMLSSAAHAMMDPIFVDSPVLESYDYSPFGAYGNSKMANILHAQALNDRFAKQNVFSVSVHPGVIMTNLGKHFNPLILLSQPRVLLNMPYLKSIPEGTSSQVYAALRSPLPSTGGKYFVDCNVAPMLTLEAQVFFDNSSTREQLWKVSEQLIQTALLKIGQTSISSSTG